MNKKLFPVVFAAVLVAVTVIGLVRGVTTAGDPNQTPPTLAASPTARTTPSPGLDHGEGDHGRDSDTTTSSPTPTNMPTPAGSDHDHGNEHLPVELKPIVVERTREFWDAFSIQHPGRRDRAVAKVATPYLAEKMSVRSTERIPVVKVKRTAIVAGTFSSAVAVSQTSDGWWYVTFVYDPVKDGKNAWNAQEYQRAPIGMIADARRKFDEQKNHKR